MMPWRGLRRNRRLADEQVVLPEGRPVELLPSARERVRRMQAELVQPLPPAAATCLSGRLTNAGLRVFPPRLSVRANVVTCDKD